MFLIMILKQISGNNLEVGMDKLQFKKLDERAVLPKKGTDRSLGYDLCGISVPEVKTFEASGGQGFGVETLLGGNLAVGFRLIIRTGLACQFDELNACNILHLVFNERSGDAIKYAIKLLAGWIDNDYRDELKVLLWCPTVEGVKHIKAKIDEGKPIAQFMVVREVGDIKIEEVSELDSTDRKGGFGSTDSSKI